MRFVPFLLLPKIAHIISNTFWLIIFTLHFLKKIEVDVRDLQVKTCYLSNIRLVPFQWEIAMKVTTHKSTQIPMFNRSQKMDRIPILSDDRYCHGMTKSVRKTNRLTKMLFLLFWPVSCVSLISLIEI